MGNEQSKPIKPFTYPGGKRMCSAGRIRAAVYGKRILSDEAVPEDIKDLAERGEYALARGADTNKRNIIAKVVYFLAIRNELGHFINENGDFIDGNGRLVNLDDFDEIAGMFRE